MSIGEHVCSAAFGSLARHDADTVFELLAVVRGGILPGVQETRETSPARLCSSSSKACLRCVPTSRIGDVVSSRAM